MKCLSHLCVFLMIFLSGISIQAGSVSDVLTTREQTTLTLASDSESISPGDAFYLSLTLSIKDGWHTYWINPGDAGAPAELSWEVSEGVSIGEALWPPPKKIAYGSLTTYGYDSQVTVIVPVKTSPSLAKGKIITITLNAEWLICEEICIPESAKLSLDIPIEETKKRIPVSSKIDIIIKKHPQPFPFPVSFMYSETSVSLSWENDHNTPRDLYIFPDSEAHVIPQYEQDVQINGKKIRVTLPTYEKSTQFQGVMTYITSDGEPQAYSITDTVPGKTKKDLSKKWPLLTMLGLAFLGGLILNIMPCVFPILSLKLLSILKNNTQSRSEVRKHGIVYTAGVLVGLWVLFLIIRMVKLGGGQIGWGFHLQSPVFIGILIVILMYIGLYLLGAAPLPGILYRLSSLSGSTHSNHSFLTGLLAVIVATPCTAPFMAVAIGAAFVVNSFFGIMIFTALGIGFSFPFLLFSFYPKLGAFLPKPGPWLERFKEAMAFPMFFTVVWLLWVLQNQVGPSEVAYAASLIVGVGMMAWISLKFPKSTWLHWAIVIIIVGGLFQLNPAKDSVQLNDSHKVSDIQSLVAQRKKVFVDVTAAWCITCQVNKQRVLDTTEIQTIFQENDVTLIRLDWTSKDTSITTFLNSYNRSGVPLYLYINEEGEEEVLPQILSKDHIKEAMYRNKTSRF